MDKKGQFRSIYQAFVDKFLTEEERANPWVTTTLLTIIRDAISSLKTHIENETEPEITWSLPSVLLAYPVQIEWEKINPAPLKIEEPIPLIRASREIDKYLRYNELPEGLFAGTSKEINGLRLLSNNVASITDFSKKLIGEGDQATFLIPSGVIEKWRKVSEKKRQKLAKKEIIKGFRTFRLKLSEGTVTDSKTGKQKRAWGSLIIEFRPLQIISQNGIARYPIGVELEFKGCKPVRWTPKDKEEFWSFLLKGIADIISEKDVTVKTLSADKTWISLSVSQPLPEPIITTIKEALHRQPRGYLKTMASLVGRDTQQPSLFDLPALKSEDIPDIKDVKEAISKDTAITGNYLIELWQKKKNEAGILVIDNLTEVAEHLSMTAQRLKLYLIYLGGYQYPVIKLERQAKDKNILTISHAKLCEIEFKFDLKDHEVENVENLKIGTRYLYFMRNTPVKTITFKPSETTREEIEAGRGCILPAILK